MEMRVFLVRHGQTDWNITNRAQGHADIELNAEGSSQSRDLASRLIHLDIERILSSDLKRCRQTIGPFLEKTSCVPDFRQDLRERTFGSMEGQDYRELHLWMGEQAVQTGVPEWQVRPTGGESMADVWLRLDAIEAELREDRRTTLVVSHGGALAQLLAKLIKGTPETPRAFRFSNCGVTTLGRRPDGSFLLERFDDCPERRSC